MRLQGFDLCKIKRVEQNAGGMQSPQSRPGEAIEQRIVGDRAFPAHATNQANGLDDRL